MTAEQQCGHWRYIDGGGRVLKAEYADPKGCKYCEVERANADFRELLLTNGRIGKRNLAMSAEIGRLRTALADLMNGQLGAGVDLDAPRFQRAREALAGQAAETARCLCRVGEGPQEDCPIHGRGAPLWKHPAY